MESLEEDTDNDSAASCESAGEEDPEGIDADALEQMLQAAGKEKLLTIRCAAHSLQLLMCFFLSIDYVDHFLFSVLVKTLN